jgi:hypothetical protein
VHAAHCPHPACTKKKLPSPKRIASYSYTYSIITQPPPLDPIYIIYGSIWGGGYTFTYIMHDGPLVYTPFEAFAVSLSDGKEIKRHMSETSRVLEGGQLMTVAKPDARAAPSRPD